MAKRFIDTEIFSDEWFGELSKDAKLFFIYYITNCNHAGILKLNRKLCSFQTGITDVSAAIREVGRTIEFKESCFFMPAFMKFQYPEFPNSKVKQQDSALKILIDSGLWVSELNTYITLNEQLPKSLKTVKEDLSESYDNDIVNDNGSVIDIFSSPNVDYTPTKQQKKINLRVSDEDVEVTREEAFGMFWDMYDHKKARPVAEKKFLKLPVATMQKIFDAVESYVESTPDKQYRKYPATWLNQECWDDDIIKPSTPTPTAKHHSHFFCHPETGEKLKYRRPDGLKYADSMWSGMTKLEYAWHAYSHGRMTDEVFEEYVTEDNSINLEDILQ